MRAKPTVTLTLRNRENIKTGKVRVEPKHLTTEIRRVAETLRLKRGGIDAFSLFLREASVLLGTPTRETLEILWREDVKGNILVSTHLKALELTRKKPVNRLV